MNTIKTIILTLVVTSIGYGAYLVITQEPPVAPEGAQEAWAEPPMIELDQAQPGSGFAPLPGAAPTPGDTAPPFAPAGTSEAPPFSAGGDAPAFAPAPAVAPPVATEPMAGTLAPPPDWAANPGAPAAPPTNTEPIPGPATNDLAGTAPTPGLPPAAPAVGDPFSPPAPAGPALGANPPSPAVPLGAAYPPEASPPAGTAPGVAPNAALPAGGTPPAMTPQFGATSPGAPAAPATSFAATIASVQAKLDAEQYVEAHRELSQWYERRELTEDERRQLLELLDALTGTVIYSRDFHAEPAYEVQPGDDLERIAQQYNIPWQFLQRINGVEDPRQLSPGQKLKVVRGPFRATVDLELGQLTVWLNDRYAGRFPIGRNAPGATPEGEYQVQSKIENPSFYGADGTIEAGDPANPLGERWIELSEQVGIHGAPDINTVRHADTAHCIRMHATDVEDLYDILSVGSTVTVRR